MKQLISVSFSTPCRPLFDNLNTRDFTGLSDQELTEFISRLDLNKASVFTNEDSKAAQVVPEENTLFQGKFSFYGKHDDSLERKCVFSAYWQ